MKLAFSAMLFHAGALWAVSNTWTSIGPHGGYARALAIDPQTPDTVYVGTTAGVFKTTNGGANWSAANSGLPRGYFPRSIAIDPQRPNIVYVGGACGTYGACGMFKSTDRGANWSPINSGLESTVIVVESLAVDPQNSDTLYAGTTACFQTSGTPGWVAGADNLCYRPGLFKSTDGGASWMSANNGLPWASVNFGYVMALAIDTQTSSTVYAVTGGGLFKSTDRGASWSSLPLRATALVIDPQKPSTLYAAGSGIWKSTDGGVSWSNAKSGLPSNCCGSLAIDPQNPNVIYAGVYDGGAFMSTDGGATWSDTGLPSMRDNSIAVDPPNPSAGLAVDPQNPGTLYAATNGAGLFKSTDGAGSWRPVNQGLSATSVYASAIDPQNPDTIYAETSTGIVKTTDRGTKWSSSNSGLPVPLGDASLILSPTVRSIAIDPRTPSTLYAGVSGNLGNSQQPGGVFKSVDAGATWIAASSPLGLGLFLTSLAVDPQNPNTLYAAGYGAGANGSVSGVRKSTDGGNTWTAAGSLPSYVRALVIDSQSALYAVGDGWIARSTDGGTGWTNLLVPAGLLGDCEECVLLGVLAVDPQRQDTLYAGGSVGVVKSTDGGASWNLMNTGLPLSSHDWFGVTALVIDPRDPKTLYAALAGKVFRSTDGAASWIEVSVGITVTSVSTLMIDSKNPSTVYAGTYGGGIFAITFPTLNAIAGHNGRR
jgi:photosystem II stability/assembly factor-like uncharacterized protein